MNKYPLWKYITLLFIIVFSVVYSLPNLYGDFPVIEISSYGNENSLSDNDVKSAITAIEESKLNYRVITQSNKNIILRFFSTDDQLKAKDVVSEKLGNKFTVALNLLSSTPNWLKKINAFPMKLGLDLRGGVHFLLDVDVESVVAKRMDSLVSNITKELREDRIRASKISTEKSSKTIKLFFYENDKSVEALRKLRKEFSDLTIMKTQEDQPDGQIYLISLQMNNNYIDSIKQNTIEQTLSTLRNRVDELGVSEAVVQQQGINRISIDLPGIQDATRARDILGGTATVEFHIVKDLDFSGSAPIGYKSFKYRGNRVLLNKQVVLSGSSITNANSAYDENSSPAVSIQLGGGGERIFNKATRENIGKSMATVFIETRTFNKKIGDEIVKNRVKTEKIINVATIQSALSNRFQITGISSMEEARNLSLLLRAGALPTSIDIVEERTIGPTLGADNIRRGLLSLEVGIAIVMIFMLIYYRFFGLVANIALALNLILLVSILSIIEATLTLPGIAGIVLTLGMAVDANVLIYERIREELRSGTPAQMSIFLGYDKALTTIIDANVTTFLVGIVLFFIGSGAIQGFAITLMIGLFTSMITGIGCSRAITNIFYGRRKKLDNISIGI